MTIYEATVSNDEGQNFRTMAATEALARQECERWLDEVYADDAHSRAFHGHVIEVVEWLVVTEPYARPKLTKAAK